MIEEDQGRAISMIEGEPILIQGHVTRVEKWDNSHYLALWLHNQQRHISHVLTAAKKGVVPMDARIRERAK